MQITTYKVFRLASGLIFPILALLEYDNPQFLKALIASLVIGPLFYFVLFPMAVGLFSNSNSVAEEDEDSS